MKPLIFLANAFINTFGITQPTEAAAKRASQFIAVLIGLVILIFLGVAAVGIYILMRH
jgi:heme/copper-type cytochrome/quinol oxidase subunit 2